MRLHILGIGGTFMSGLAVLAKQSGYQVTGSDMNVYPPMSVQLESLGIKLIEGYSPDDIDWAIDYVIVGNIIKRGNPAMEYVLSNRLPYISGPAWLADHVLKNRCVLAIAGTHGKTTTSSLLAFILDRAGLMPGFLIGGIPENFDMSARLGKSPYFVIEADEYDSAFFDKRSKFIHYHPSILVLNNLEYDHADIFPDLAAIKQQFHYLLRTVPSNGCILWQAQDRQLADLIQQGCWTPQVTFGSEEANWRATPIEKDGSVFDVYHEGRYVGTVQWKLIGQHNIANAIAAIATAYQVNVAPTQAIAILSEFKNVKRRLEVKGKIAGITIYDDFAHHPTAIKTTLAGLRAKIGQERIIVIIEFASYTMRQGIHKANIQEALSAADKVICKATAAEWGLQALLAQFTQPTAIYSDVDTLINAVVPTLQSGDHVVIMSNRDFDDIHRKLMQAMEKRLANHDQRFDVINESQKGLRSS